MAVVAWAVAMGAAGALLSSSQSDARSVLEQRLTTRVSTGAEFASLYTQSVIEREEARAEALLATRTVTQHTFALLSADLGFPAAVLLDARGRLLRVVPDQPSLLGKVLTGKYAHLAAAVAGHVAVSDVVRSAARGIPVVGLAVPFATPYGRRVFSGTLAVAGSPLGVYMTHMITVPGRRVYLVDAAGALVASSRAGGAGRTLRDLDPRLAMSAARAAAGSYSTPVGRDTFVSAPVAGTPWRLIASVPDAQLFASVNGASRWLAWIAVASLALAGLIIITLMAGLLRGRRQLAVLNAELSRIARVDTLTGLRNRRDIEETLQVAMSSSRRREETFAVLLIDIDHFKAINDGLGHRAGDDVLRSAGQTMRSALRAEDTLGRWGGEEFVAVLPNTDADSAAIVAERLRAEVSVSVAQDPPVTLTVTIGVAIWESGSDDDLMARADAALYAGKSAGRNTVRICQNEDRPVSLAR